MFFGQVIAKAWPIKPEAVFKKVYKREGFEYFCAQMERLASLYLRNRKFAQMERLASQYLRSFRQQLAQMAKRLTRSAAARVFPGSIPGLRFLIQKCKVNFLSYSRFNNISLAKILTF